MFVCCMCDRSLAQCRHLHNQVSESFLQERDFDEFARHIRTAAPSDPLIFNCQLGGGRTTTGTVIGCLVRSFAAVGEQHDSSGAAATATAAGAGSPANAANGEDAEPGVF